MDYIYKNIEENSLSKKCKILIVFDDTITDVLSNGKINPIVTEASIRDRMLNIPLALIYNFILICQKILVEILRIILL